MSSTASVCQQHGSLLWACQHAISFWRCDGFECHINRKRGRELLIDSFEGLTMCSDQILFYLRSRILNSQLCFTNGCVLSKDRITGSIICSCFAIALCSSPSPACAISLHVCRGSALTLSNNALQHYLTCPAAVCLAWSHPLAADSRPGPAVCCWYTALPASG